MNKFKKIVAIDNVSLTPDGVAQLQTFAEEVVMYDSVPTDVSETIKRIGDADAALLSYQSCIPRDVLEQCPTLRYIGMCCSLYAPENANVDIRYAEQHGITVKGIRDYGDEGVVEYIVSELVRRLHGFGCPPWFGKPSEITGLKVGMVGLGTSGGMIADTLRFFGAEISYFARSEKASAAAKGYRFMPLAELLERSDVVCCCLNRNTILLHEEEMRLLGEHKILFNTGLTPAWDSEPFIQWINKDNLCYCDTFGALGDTSLLNHPHIFCVGASSGMTRQAYVRLTHKVIGNIQEYLKHTFPQKL